MAMNVGEWRDFLGELSRVILAHDISANDDANRPHFCDAIRASGYIGYAGASEAQIRVAEARLNCVFPPSYRAFLSVSNGWPANWHSVEPGQLWACEQIRWTSEQDPDLVPYVAEEFCFAREETIFVRPLSISEHGDACDLLLLPQAKSEPGEWECWKHGSWCGVERWNSFEDWFKSVLQFYRTANRSFF